MPTFFNYQGRLMSPVGVPVENGTYQVTFRIFPSPTGGTELWSENQTVQTKSGAFEVMLGKTQSFPANLFTKRLWLEIQVGERVLRPRQELGSVAFAMTALSVPNGTITTAMIASRAINADKLANNAVITRTIQNGAVTTEKLADASVTEAKLAPGMLVPIGSVITWWGNSATPPAGWQVCDGSAITDSASPLVGLNTPDLRDRFVRGATGDVRSSPVSGGSDTHTLSVAQMPSHSHGINDPGHSHEQLTYDSNHGGQPNRPRPPHQWTTFVDFSGGHTAGAVTGISVQGSGGGQAFPTVPRYAGLIYLMRVR